MGNKYYRKPYFKENIVKCFLYFFLGKQKKYTWNEKNIAYRCVWFSVKCSTISEHSNKKIAFLKVNKWWSLRRIIAWKRLSFEWAFLESLYCFKASYIIAVKLVKWALYNPPIKDQDTINLVAHFFPLLLIEKYHNELS